MHKRSKLKLIINLLKNQCKNLFKNQLINLLNNLIRNQFKIQFKNQFKSLKEPYQFRIQQQNRFLKINQFNRKILKLITKQRILRKMMMIKFFYKRLKCLNRCYKTKRKVLLKKLPKQKKINKT